MPGTASPFVHLRVHSAFSLLESSIQAEDLPELCRQHRMPAVAVTDTNNLFGLYELAEPLMAAGVQPIIGCQLTLDVSAELPGRPKVLARSIEGQGVERGSIALLVMNEGGYRNLIRLMSRAYLEAPAGEKPVIDLDMLEAHAGGLILLTGGPKSALDKLLRANQEAAGERVLKRLAALFPGRLYVELQRHGLAHEAEAEPRLIALAYSHDLPLVATNEPYFAKASGHAAHDALLCIADGNYIVQETRRRETPEHFFKSGEAMAALFADLPEAVENTAEIARRCNFVLKGRAPILPRFAPASGLSPDEELRAQAKAGLTHRLKTHGFHRPEADYWDRLAYELDIIVGMNFSSYFLIVSDFMKWARGHGIPVGVRGSGAGSIVAWALEITSLDPLRFGLVFERFLNPERVSMPDFDIDFCQERRGEVIRYVQEKYGYDRVAQIITLGTLQARAAIRDVGRVLQLPHGLVDRISKMIKVRPGQSVSLREAIAQEPRMQAAAEDETVKRMFEIALELEGLYRHAGTHAAGVVIADRPLDELIPLYRDPSADMPVTQLDYKQGERAGLVKFDFLGLKTLTVIAASEALIAQNKGLTIKTEDMPFDDPQAFQILGRGDSTGVFQLESSGMRGLLRKMKPDRIEDLIALVALYRPGPMDNIPKYIECKHGRDKPIYLHPMLEPILSGTYGVMTYQEDVMLIARELAGYSLGQADELRKAMGKKIKEKMAEHRVKFIGGAGARGIPEGVADLIFEQAAKFAGYGFNKAHAAAYAQVAYQTAWLKANHPVEFLCASMTMDIGAPERLNMFRQEAERFGIRVLAPDINRSGAVFNSGTGTDGVSEIYYALAAVRNVGRQAMDHVEAERLRHGPYRSVFDFARRVDPRLINKRALESLMQAGAFDQMLAHRAQGVAGVDLILRESNASAQERQSQQVNLFEGDGPARDPALPDAKVWTLPEKLSREFDAVGFYISGHPLEEFATALKRMRVQSYASLFEDRRREARAVTLAGTVIRRQERRTRDEKTMAHIGFSDPTGVFEAVAFSEALAAAGAVLEPGQPALITAQLRWEDDEPKLQIHGARPLAAAAADAVTGLRIMVEEASALPSIAERIRGHRGRGLITLVLPLKSEGQEAEIELPDRYAVSMDLRRAVKEVTGVVEVEEI